MRMLKKEHLHGSVELKTYALSKIDRMMLLQLNYVKITGSCKDFPKKKLIWLCMHGFPLKFVTLNLQIRNLVALEMSYRKIESFGISCSYPRLLKRLKVTYLHLLLFLVELIKFTTILTYLSFSN